MSLNNCIYVCHHHHNPDEDHFHPLYVSAHDPRRSLQDGRLTRRMDGDESTSGFMKGMNDCRSERTTAIM